MGLLRSVATAAASVLLLSLPTTSPSVAVSSTGVDRVHRVAIRVVYRAFCPACQWFIGNPLLELVRAEDYRAIVNLTLVPVGGMRETKQGELACEAGPLECTGHRWQVCVLDRNRGDIVKYIAILACIEGDESGKEGDWPTKMKRCVTDEEHVRIDECYKNRSMDLLLKLVREKRPGSSPWLPHTAVNVNVLGSATEGVSLKMLKTSICLAYAGPASFYPVGCEKLVGRQKRIVSEDTTTHNKNQYMVTAETTSKAIPAPVKNVENTVVEEPVIADGGDSVVADMKEEGRAIALLAHTSATTKVADSAVADMKEEGGVIAAPAHTSATTKAGKVVVDMYWRALCLGCVSFITRPLLSLVRDKEFQEIIDFRPVPAAGTSYDAKGKFVCTSGNLECQGHKWLSCAVEEFPQIGELVEHIACMESKDNSGMTWKFIIHRCFEGEAQTKMQSCYDVKSDELLRKNVAKKQALHVPWVPYVLINGIPLGSSTHGVGLKQLTDAVCKAYTGPENLPAACLSNRLRNEAEAKLPAEGDVVKPCPPKRINSGDTRAQHEDAPGIGKPLPSEREAKAVKNYGAKVTGGRQADDGKSSATVTAIVLAGLCFVGLVVIARRLSRNHKKSA